MLDAAFAKLVEAGALVSGNTRHPNSLVCAMGEVKTGVAFLGRLMQRLTIDVEAVRLVFNGIRFRVLAECEMLAAMIWQKRSPFVEEQYWPVDRLRVLRVMIACSILGEPHAKLIAYQAWRAENRARRSRWRGEPKARPKGKVHYGDHANDQRGSLAATPFC